jgi:hypothetical protein
MQTVLNEKKVSIVLRHTEGVGAAKGARFETKVQPQ